MPHLKTAVRVAATGDADAIAQIYNHYILHTVVTFEEDPVTAAEMKRRMEEVLRANLPWLVAEQGNTIVGYAYANHWHKRAAYRHAVETTVYLAQGIQGQGIGSRLYAQVLAMLPERNIHTAIGGIALPNDASVALHEKFGFRKVAHYKEVGFKFNRWIDVGYWQGILPTKPGDSTLISPFRAEL